MTNESTAAPSGVTVEVKSGPQGATPSEQAVKMRAKEATITDPRGRIIKLKRPGVLAQYRFIEAMGEANDRYMNAVSPLMFIESIDGDRANTSNKLQIEAMIQRLDEEGLAAVMEGVRDNFGQIDPKADREALKG